MPFDDAVLIWLHQFVYRWPLFDKGVAWLSEATLFKFGLMMLAICWLWFDVGPRRATRRRLLLDAVIAGFVALIVGRALALILPFHERPFARADLGLSYPVDVGLSTWSSLPSDHAVMAFALAASLFRASPVVGVLAVIEAVLFICLPRLYLGLHHPSDLIAGALVGICIAYAIGWIDRRGTLTGPLFRLEVVKPALFYTVGFFTLFEIAEMFQSFRQLAKPLFRELHQLIA